MAGRPVGAFPPNQGGWDSAVRCNPVRPRARPFITMPDKDLHVSRRDWLRLGSCLIPVGFSVDRLIAWQDQPANAQPAGAQPANAQPSFSTDVSVVNVLVNVRDKQGKIVHDLTKDDFTIEEDGRPQTIKYFAQQSGTPLTLGLLVDTSESQRRLIDQERSASRDFLQHVLREDQDKAFLIHFDREVELLQDLTSSRKELNVALDQVEATRPQLNRRDSGGSQDGGDYPQGGGGGYPGGQGGGGRYGRGGGGTTLYDAILLGSDEIMKKQQGRKAMIVLSDGVDHGSRVTLNEAIESAQKADTLVYAIRFADTQFTAIAAADSAVWAAEEWAVGSGGSVEWAADAAAA